MNEHTSHPSSHLGRLLDEATAHYNPQPDVARFERMLQVQHRRRAGVIVWSAAACFALIGGTAFAFNQQPGDRKLSPANSAVEHESDSTVVKTTEHRPDKTLPDGGHDPIDKTTVPTEPPATEPATEPSTTEKKHEEPKTTEPKNTEPKTTEPGDGEPTTTDGEESTWSVHQVHGSSDAEPPSDVFWGTANIGDKIIIESAYGRVKVFANDVGAWEAHITFEGAPIGVAFQVWVHAPYHDEAFWFTYLG
ncbi:MAG: hypothetical protein K8R99_13215 [Actinomycetia bacterium]|nr:hypothetical protein [Actinomycetes bacterium]